MGEGPKQAGPARYESAEQILGEVAARLALQKSTIATVFGRCEGPAALEQGLRRLKLRLPPAELAILLEYLDPGGDDGMAPRPGRMLARLEKFLHKQRARSQVERRRIGNQITSGEADSMLRAAERRQLLSAATALEQGAAVEQLKLPQIHARRVHGVSNLGARVMGR